METTVIINGKSNSDTFTSDSGDKTDVFLWHEGITIELPQWLRPFVQIIKWYIFQKLPNVISQNTGYNTWSKIIFPKETLHIFSRPSV